MYLNPASTKKMTATGSPRISRACNTIFKRSQKLETASGFSTLQARPLQRGVPPLVFAAGGMY